MYHMEQPVLEGEAAFSAGLMYIKLRALHWSTAFRLQKGKELTLKYVMAELRTIPSDLRGLVSYLINRISQANK